MMRILGFRRFKIELPSKNWVAFLFVWLIMMTFLIFGKLVPAIRENFQLKELLNKKEEIFIRYRKKLAIEKEKLEQYKKAANFNQELDKIFLAQDPYVLVSEIQSLMDNIPSLKVKTFRITSTREVSEGIQMITVQFAIEADIKALVELLKRFSSQTQSLRLKNLNIYSLKKKEGWMLNINLDIEALLYSES